MTSGNTSNAYREYLDYRSVAQRRMAVLPGGKIAPATLIRQDKVILVTSIICLFVLAFIYLYLSAQIGLASKEIASLKGKIIDMENSTARAELAYCELNSLARIENYAIENLNMVYPDSESIYYLSEENSMIIAEGLAALSEDETVIAKDNEGAVDNGWWQSLAVMFDDHFFNKSDHAQ